MSASAAGGSGRGGGQGDGSAAVAAARGGGAGAAAAAADDGMYTELWNLCAGPLVTVPKVGDKVYYFPQGHIEQVEASINQVAEQHMQLYNLPWKIPCEVMNVELKAEPDTDEVYAQLTLLPESKQEESPSSGEEMSTAPPAAPARPHVHSFCKTLTASDTSTHGGFSVLRRHADECLPPLDMSLQPPTQELVAKDLHGAEWRFRHIFRGQPRRHLLQSGWSVFVSAKRLVAGDAFIFLSMEAAKDRGSKRPIGEVSQDTPSENPEKSLVTLQVSKRFKASTSSAVSAAEQDKLLPHKAVCLAGISNPEFQDSLRTVDILGVDRSIVNWTPPNRALTIQVATLRSIVDNLSQNVLRSYVAPAGNMPTAALDNFIATSGPILANAFMAALYAKLQTIHKNLQLHPTRYPSHPRFYKDLELPLPFAIAVDQFGIFEATNIVNYRIVVPTYAENTPHEGCTHGFNPSTYLSLCTRLKTYGLPFKTVDSCKTEGTPWWTLKALLTHGTFDLKCIYPQSHYSELAAIIRMMFLARCEVNNRAEVLNFIEFNDNEADYPRRARNLPDSISICTFHALCHLPDHHWTTSTVFMP